MDRASVRTAGKLSFHSPVLIAQRYFQMKNILPMALKTKVTGFDNPRVNRADRNLVDLIALDPVKVGHADLRETLPGIFGLTIPVGGMEPDGLEPRMPRGPNSPLLEYLALKPVRLRAIRSYRIIPVAVDIGIKQQDDGLTVMRQNSPKPYPAPFDWPAEKSGNS
jgi:hypothetical protein